jgi:hypothetical protein
MLSILVQNQDPGLDPLKCQDHLVYPEGVEIQSRLENLSDIGQDQGQKTKHDPGLNTQMHREVGDQDQILLKGHILSLLRDWSGPGQALKSVLRGMHRGIHTILLHSPWKGHGPGPMIGEGIVLR